MSTIGYIKAQVNEVQPELENGIVVLSSCLEKLRSCGIFSEEMTCLAEAIEKLEETNTLLSEHIKELKTVDDE